MDTQLKNPEELSEAASMEQSEIPLNDPDMGETLIQKEDILKDIFHNSGTIMEKIEQYQSTKKESQVQLSQYVYNEYKNFIKISKEIKHLNDSFSNMKQIIDQFGGVVKHSEQLIQVEKLDMLSQTSGSQMNTQETLKRIQQATVLKEENVAQFLNIGFLRRPFKIKKRIYEAKETIQQKLEDLDLNTYEKKYSVCVKKVLEFREKAQKKPQSMEARLYKHREQVKKMNLIFQRLYKSICTDLTSCKEEKVKVFIGYLKQLGVVGKGVKGYLKRYSRKLRRDIKSKIDELPSLDEKNIKELVRYHLQQLKSICDQFQELFEITLEQNYELFSEFSLFAREEIEFFLNEFKEHLIVERDFALTMDFIKSFVEEVFKFEKEGLSLLNHVQILLLEDIREYLVQRLEPDSAQIDKILEKDDTHTTYFRIFSATHREHINPRHREDSDKLIDQELLKKSAKNLKMLEMDDQENQQNFENITRQMTMEQFFQNVGEDVEVTRGVNVFWNILIKQQFECFEVLNMSKLPLISIEIFLCFQENLYMNVEKLLKINTEKGITQDQEKNKDLLANLLNIPMIVEKLVELIKAKCPDFMSAVLEKKWGQLVQRFRDAFDDNIWEYYKKMILLRVPKLLDQTYNASQKNLQEFQFQAIPEIPSNYAISVWHQIDKMLAIFTCFMDDLTFSKQLMLLQDLILILQHHFMFTKGRNDAEQIKMKYPFNPDALKTLKRQKEFLNTISVKKQIFEFKIERLPSIKFTQILFDNLFLFKMFFKRLRKTYRLHNRINTKFVTHKSSLYNNELIAKYTAQSGVRKSSISYEQTLFENKIFIIVQEYLKMKKQKRQRTKSIKQQRESVQLKQPEEQKNEQ